MPDDLFCIEEGCTRLSVSKKWSMCKRHYTKASRAVPRNSVCAGCSEPFVTTGRITYCSDNCRISETKKRRLESLPEIHPTLKTCIRCEETKPRDEFGKDKKRRDGLFPQCKDCRREYMGSKRREAAELSRSEYDKKRREAIKADPVLHSEQTLANRNKWLFSKYGITADDYESMVENQGGVCAICNRSPEEIGMTTRGGHLSPLYVDHDHSCCPTDTTCGDCIRQLLCHTCNFGIGAFNDDLDMLRSAIVYLEKHAS